MDASADQPQIGSITVERSALAEPGTDLATALGTLGFEVSTEGVPDDAPSGWRVLARRADGVLLGAPTTDRPGWWTLAYARSRDGQSPADVQVHAEPQRLRPSRAERSRGLVLRWPEVTRSEPDFGRLAVDIVNAGDQRWRPDGDSFASIGFITGPGGSSAAGYFAFAGGGFSAVPLGPGEYARVSVRLDGSQWKDRKPGRHEISATLVDLDVRTESPLEVELTAELIERYRPHDERPRASSPDLRRDLEERLDGTHAILGAQKQFAAVFETVAAATSDEAAVLGIRELLGCSSDAARQVYETPLRRYRAEHIRRLSEEARDLEQRIAQAAAAEASAADRP
ncbi:hypothetical protein [Agromyces subbeticus]|uniref:hypothetical protein n=1 Tax=Agromyces subbeticus TaxID=293890 RepID=UPI0003B7641C|nr:hypothetical protein [Agromyces subbeticus]